MNERQAGPHEKDAARRARAARRTERMVANRAASFEEAEAWDLDFWQSRTPQERLSALVELRRDVALALAARSGDHITKR